MWRHHAALLVTLRRVKNWYQYLLFYDRFRALERGMERQTSQCNFGGAWSAAWRQERERERERTGVAQPLERCGDLERIAIEAQCGGTTRRSKSRDVE